MLDSPLAPYLYWAKKRTARPIDLAGSNLLACTLDELPGARDAVDLIAADVNGYPPLVDAIAAHYGVDANRVVTAPGCSAANFLAIAALVGAGDRVLMEAPAYDQITGACRLLGAEVDYFDRRFDDGYGIDVETVRKQLTPRTKLIIVSTPHNPSGALINPATLAALNQLATDAKVFVLVDEVYLDATNILMTTPVGSPRAAGRYTPAALIGDRLISTSSLTKSYGLAGLRCGWIVTTAALAERMRRVRDVIDNIGAAPADRLATLAFAHLDELANRTRRLLTPNLAAARAFLAKHPQLETSVPVEATIVFPRFAGRRDAGTFVTRLAESHGIAVAPGHFFGAPAHFRISLAGRSDMLAAGLTALSAAIDADLHA